jgi:YHS domain-containing protein
MKTLATVVQATVVLCACAALAYGGEHAAAQPGSSAAVQNFNNPKCPVMGGDVNGKDFAVVNNVRYGLCCPSCKAELEGNPEQYLAKMPNEGRIVDLKNAKCPVSGEPVDAKTTLVYNGTKIHFCCPGCPPKFKADPDKYLKKLQTEAPAPEASAAPAASAE